LISAKQMYRNAAAVHLSIGFKGMLKVKRKYILFISAAVLAAAAALVFTYWFLTLNRSFSLPRAYPEPNAEWQAVNPNIKVFSDEEGNLSGEFYLDDVTLNLRFYLRDDSVSIYLPEYEDFLLFGTYSINKNGDIVIKDISSDSEFWSSDITEITLKTLKK